EEAVWLVGEWREATGEHKYYLTIHRPRTSLRRLAGAIKARWVCEQAHQQLKEELGLDHFDGRSWPGLHHHTLMPLISFAFLQHLRLQEVKRAVRRGESGAAAARRRPTGALAARDPARHAGQGASGPSPMSEMQRTATLSDARVNVAKYCQYRRTLGMHGGILTPEPSANSVPLKLRNGAPVPRSETLFYLLGECRPRPLLAPVHL